MTTRRADVEAPERLDGAEIYRRLRQEILVGALPPGTALREVALAERFGVSRTPVREALGRLAHERLLDRVERGLVVHGVDADEVIQVYDMRVMLEGEAAAQAARSRSIAQLVHLERLLARDRALEDPDDRTRLTTNLEFHAAVWEATGNRVLVDLLERLSVHLVHTPRPTLSVGDRWEVALDEHAALVDAIAEQDAERAREVARAHMSEARRIRLQLIRAAVD